MGNSKYDKFNIAIDEIRSALQITDAHNNLCNLFTTDEYSLFTTFTESLRALRIKDGNISFPNLAFEVESLNFTPYNEFGKKIIFSQIIGNFLMLSQSFPTNSLSGALVSQTLPLLSNALMEALEIKL